MQDNICLSVSVLTNTFNKKNTDINFEIWFYVKGKHVWSISNIFSKFEDKSNPNQIVSVRTFFVYFILFYIW